jgi:hypothetical protein
MPEIETMANADDTSNAGGGTENTGEKLPVMQQLLDNPFLLLFIGVTMPTVFYIIWGVMEIVTIPIAQ